MITTLGSFMAALREIVDQAENYVPDSGEVDTGKFPVYITPQGYFAMDLPSEVLRSMESKAFKSLALKGVMFEPSTGTVMIPVLHCRGHVT